MKHLTLVPENEKFKTSTYTYNVQNGAKGREGIWTCMVNNWLIKLIHIIMTTSTAQISTGEHFRYPLQAS